MITEPSNKGMKLTSVEHNERSQLISSVRLTIMIPFSRSGMVALLLYGGDRALVLADSRTDRR